MAKIACSLCDEINEKDNTVATFLKGYDSSLENRIIFENRNWVVMPTLGCFIEGYILIVSKNHLTSIASISSDMAAELYELLLNIEKLYKRELGISCIFFEHGNLMGNADDETESCCIEHLHLHVMPFTFNIWDEMVDIFKFHYIPVEGLKNINKVLSMNSFKSYLFFKNIDQKSYIIDAGNAAIPPQFFRKIISKKLDIPLMWDWRRFACPENMIKTIEMLKGKI